MLKLIIQSREIIKSGFVKIIKKDESYSYYSTIKENYYHTYRCTVKDEPFDNYFIGMSNQRDHHRSIYSAIDNYNIFMFWSSQYWQVTIGRILGIEIDLSDDCSKIMSEILSKIRSR